MFDQSSNSKPPPHTSACDDIRFRWWFKNLQHCSSVANQSHVCRRRLYATNRRESVYSRRELFSIRTATLRAAPIAENFSKRFAKLTRTFQKLFSCHISSQLPPSDDYWNKISSRASFHFTNKLPERSLIVGESTKKSRKAILASIKNLWHSKTATIKN